MLLLLRLRLPLCRGSSRISQAAPRPSEWRKLSSLGASRRNGGGLVSGVRRLSSIGAIASRGGARALVRRVRGRFFSSSTPEPVDRVKQLFSYFTPAHLRMYAIIGAAGLCVYAILSTGYRTASFLSGLSIYSGMKVGFILGIGCGIAATLVLGFTSTRFLSLRPEVVYRSMLRAVQSDPRVRSKLGHRITPLSDFRAYTFVGGDIRWDPVERAKYQGLLRKWYKPRRLQIMFTVKGENAKGMVSAEVEGSLTSGFIYIHKALDVMDTEERILLQGRDDKTVYSGRTNLR
mmetsp:Transcript_30097/g.52884  ORF Transcript_30097/g.52884 Transcript_30097/m.52884 type:complete len:290 (-) Transcript_30097:563-1432(-)